MKLKRKYIRVSIIMADHEIGRSRRKLMRVFLLDYVDVSLVWGKG